MQQPTSRKSAAARMRATRARRRAGKASVRVEVSVDLIDRLAAYGLLAEDARSDSEAIGVALRAVAERTFPERPKALPSWAREMVDAAVARGVAAALRSFRG